MHFSSGGKDVMFVFGCNAYNNYMQPYSHLCLVALTVHILSGQVTKLHAVTMAFYASLR